MSEPQFGKLIDHDEIIRDAIHVSAISVKAVGWLVPGQRVGLINKDERLVGAYGTPIGIVDPFLMEPVQDGQKFWLFLFPRSTTGLRHVWTHPAFDEAVTEPVKKAEPPVVKGPPEPVWEDEDVFRCPC